MWDVHAYISKVWRGGTTEGCEGHIICTFYRDDGLDLGFHSVSRALIHALWEEVPVRGQWSGRRMPYVMEGIKFELWSRKNPRNN